MSKNIKHTSKCSASSLAFAAEQPRHSARQLAEQLQAIGVGDGESSLPGPKEDSAWAKGSGVLAACVHLQVYRVSALGSHDFIRTSQLL